MVFVQIMDPLGLKLNGNKIHNFLLILKNYDIYFLTKVKGTHRI